MVTSSQFQFSWCFYLLMHQHAKGVVFLQLCLNLPYTGSLMHFTQSDWMSNHWHVSSLKLGYYQILSRSNQNSDACNVIPEIAPCSKLNLQDTINSPDLSWRSFTPAYLTLWLVRNVCSHELSHRNHARKTLWHGTFRMIKFSTISFFPCHKW